VGVINISRVSDESLVKSITITDTGQVSFSGGAVTVNPNIDLPAGTALYVTMTSGAIRDLAGNHASGISSATGFNFSTAGGGDATAPLRTGTTPNDDATGVAVGAHLVLTYNESVQAGAGVINISRVSDEVLVRSINVTDASQVSFSGGTVTVNPNIDLPAGTALYVTMTSGAIRDLSGNHGAGISSATGFNFSTAGGSDTAAPGLIATAPPDDAAGVGVFTNLVFTYDEAVQAGSGVINISRVSDEVLVKSIDITDASQVSFAGATMTVDPDAELPFGTALYITMSADAVRDLAGNNAAGISSASTFNFTTQASAQAPLAAPAEDDTPDASSPFWVIEESGALGQLGGNGMLLMPTVAPVAFADGIFA
jgi:hypothetical protein